MDLFWQISLVELLLNVAIFAFAIIAYGPIAQIGRRFPGSVHGIGTGILFGCAMAVATLLPIHFYAAGTSVATQSSLVALAGPIAGPLAATIAAILAVVAALWHADGSLSSAVPPIAAAAAGIALHLWLTHRHRSLGYRHLPWLGLPAVTAMLGLRCLVALWNPAGLDELGMPQLMPAGNWHELARTVSASVLSGVIATTLLGTLLLREKHRLQIEAELRASEARLRLLANNATDVITRFDAAGRLSYVSPAAVEVLGLAPEGMLGTKFTSLLHPDDIDSAEQALKVLRLTRQTTITHRMRHGRTGNRVWLETSLRAIAGGTDGRAIETVGVSRDITARRAAQDELSEANRKLAAQTVDLALARDTAEAGSRAKSEFLAAMSHELRTPLNAVSGFSELMRDQICGPLDSPTYLSYAADIHESGCHLLAVINDILDFSKAEAGHLEIQTNDIDLAATVRSCLRMIAPQAEQSSVNLAASGFADLPGFSGDEMRLKQILLNLLSNAVKFTPAGGLITLSGQIDPGGQIVLRVADTGIGIKSEDLPKVMEPFRQVDGRLARTHEGTGLGLPLTRHLVELHGGTLALDSAPNAGTLVTMTFPPERTIHAPSTIGLG